MTPIADHLSVQSDRYLFILALVIGGFSVWRSIKYLVEKLDQIQNERQGDLKMIISEQREVIENNTQAFMQLAESIVELRRDLNVK
jgi:predicted PurR-regulated permease PerM